MPELIITTKSYSALPYKSSATLSGLAPSATRKASKRLVSVLIESNTLFFLNKFLIRINSFEEFLSGKNYSYLTLGKLLKYAISIQLQIDFLYHNLQHKLDWSL